MQDCWDRYKTMTLVPNSYSDKQLAHKLWSCCCKELQDDLQHMGITGTFTEEETLIKIRDLSVKAVNPLLNLCNYFKMS